MNTQAGETKTTKKTTITIKLKANDGSSSPIETLTFTPTGEEIDGGLEFWSDDAGHELTTDLQPFIGHFMPSGITKLILTSTYDVYDTKGPDSSGLQGNEHDGTPRPANRTDSNRTWQTLYDRHDHPTDIPLYVVGTGPGQPNGHD